ncbi:MAG TPA: Uma2 family endonuclease [Polyangiaceae bacterium]|nr:Uma2 family endonuclease [Polyangiaceae bacterium]
MTGAGPELRFSFREYLSVDEATPVKHEYLDGMILAVAGGTPDHAALAMAVGASLTRQLLGQKCRVFSEALRIRVQATGFAGYPDVSVVCAKLMHDPEDANTVVNPAVVVEILSPSTEHYDRGEKLRQYQLIPSLAHIVFVSHDSHRIEVVTRRDGAWSSTTAGPGGRASLSAIGCELDVDELYRDPLA